MVLLSDIALIRLRRVYGICFANLSESLHPRTAVSASVYSNSHVLAKPECVLNISIGDFGVHCLALRMNLTLRESLRLWNHRARLCYLSYLFPAINLAVDCNLAL